MQHILRRERKRDGSRLRRGREGGEGAGEAPGGGENWGGGEKDHPWRAERWTSGASELAGVPTRKQMEGENEEKKQGALVMAETRTVAREDQ